MRTFSIQTLGCKVNQYESEQIATLLRRRGLVQVDSPNADLRVVNTCSVTIQAASKSRQTIRRTMRLPTLTSTPSPSLRSSPSPGTPGEGRGEGSHRRQRIIATGCWTTSNPLEAKALGVDAVLTHHDDVAAELDRLLESWDLGSTGSTLTDQSTSSSHERLANPLGDEGSIIEAGGSVGLLTQHNKPHIVTPVKGNTRTIGTRSLPLLDSHQDSHQRALLKIQDGCDTHCTYCIIPQLRPTLWSKSVEDVVEEARRLVEAGHKEIVLTGIFLGAYGQPTAIRKRQPLATGKPLAALVDALCTQVPGLRRLRFSSLEPGDLTRDLLEVLRSHPQCVPHFHLPLQSGSDVILRRMNRQYSRDDFLRMVDDVHRAFDRPAITTDIIVSFPGESDHEFERTLDIVDRVKFIHIHAFSFSPRPGTAAARWTRDFVRGPVANDRIEIVRDRARQHGVDFRQQFTGQTVEVLVERDTPSPGTPGEGGGEGLRHGRCERYFDVWFDDTDAQPGDLVKVTIDRVTPQRTLGRARNGET